LSALIGTDPLLLMEVEPADAHEFVIAARKLFRVRRRMASALRRWSVVDSNPPGCTSFFVRLRAVSSSRPTFQSAPGGAAVKGGAEQPGATRSALQRAWRGLRGPDLDRREHGATIVVGGNSMPIPTGLWFFPHPTSVLPHRDRRSWRGSSGARVRPCCCGASDWPAVSSADPGGAGTGRRYGW
jgi:hypothetical protein